jgi:hypothetical protein
MTIIEKQSLVFWKDQVREILREKEKETEGQTDATATFDISP